MDGWVLPSHPSRVRGCTVKKRGSRSGKWGRKFIGFLSGGFCLGFLFFLPLNEIIIQVGVAAGRDPNGEPREKEKFKAKEALLRIGCEREREGYGAKICNVKTQKDEEYILKWNVK